MDNLQMVLLEPAKQLLLQMAQFVWRIFAILVILLAGWLIARVVKAVITKALRAVQLDKFSDWIELDSLLAKGGIQYSLSELIGAVSYWIILLITFVVTLSAANLIPETLLDRMISYIPNVVSGIFILILGMFVATLLRNIVQTAANNAGLAYSTFLSKFTEVVVIAFAVLMTLEQIKIGIRVSEITLGIILGTVGLAAALAFGLGCKDIAARYMNDWIEKLKKK